MPGQFRIDAARREHHRNDHAGDPARTHLRRLPDRTLVRADRYDEALAAYEARRQEQGRDPSTGGGQPRPDHTTLLHHDVVEPAH